jgi:S1-C subfamily serine protease
VASSDDGSFDQGSGDPGEGAGDPKDELGGDDRAHRGWVPPEKRVWRHPSETGPWSAERPHGAGSAPARPVGRRTAWATSLVGAGAVAALVTGGLMLASHSLPGPTGAASPPASAARSIVRLDVGSSSSSSSYGCGVAVAVGGLIATNATLLANAQWIIATTSTGRREVATVVAVDPASDVGLVRIATTLPVARFIDWSDVQAGTDAVEMAVSSASPGTATTVWSSGTIASAGEAVESGPGTGMVSVVASAPTANNSEGAVLLEPDGAVLGLLDKAGVPADGSGSVFLPGQFVKQVARELMSDGGHIVHGWLGIHGANPSAKQPAGALVVAVDRSGAADDNLRRGDVIEAIDGVRVRSMADLRSRLYLLAPGTRVDLRVDRGRTVRTVGLWLGSSA